MLVQQGDEPLIVMRLDEVNEFVNDEIFEALHRLFRHSRFSQVRRAATLHAPHFSLHFFGSPLSGMGKRK